MRSFCYFCFFFFCKKNSLFAVSLYKGVLEFLLTPTQETCLAWLIVLNNLLEDFGCSIATNFMPTTF